MIAFKTIDCPNPEEGKDCDLETENCKGQPPLNRGHLYRTQGGKKMIMLVYGDLEGITIIPF